MLPRTLLSHLAVELDPDLHAALAAGEKEIGAYTNLVGPIVSFTAVGTAQIWKLKA